MLRNAWLPSTKPASATKFWATRGGSASCDRSVSSVAFWAEDAPPGPTLVGLVATECAGAEALGPAAFGVSVHIEAVVGGWERRGRANRR